MNFRDNILKSGLCGLLILVNTGYAQNDDTQTLNKKGFFGKVIAAIATSNMAYRFNQTWSDFYNSMPGVSAREDIQKLGQEAQAALGIPAHRQVPIRYDANMDYAVAEAHGNAIVVSDQFYDDTICSRGVKRCMMYHEAAHIKYNDDSSKAFLWFGSQSGALAATKTIFNPQGRLKLLYIPSLVAGHFLARSAQGRYHNYFERRADIEGHYATQCHHCVTEKVEDLRTMRDCLHKVIQQIEVKSGPTEGEMQGMNMAKDCLKRSKRYLSVEENEIIAADLKQANKVCEFHKNGPHS